MGPRSWNLRFHLLGAVALTSALAGVGESCLHTVMLDLRAIRDSLALYLRQFPEERERQGPLLSLVESEGDIFNRRNMTGHVTASALVFDATGNRVLLVHHRGAGLWIQPGGHVDDSDPDLVAAACREVAEETGVTDVHLHPWHAERPFPFNFDTHPISARPAKGEGEHWHHDALFLLVAPGKNPLSPQLEEVGDAKWVPLGTLAQSSDSFLGKLQTKLAQELAPVSESCTDMV